MNNCIDFYTITRKSNNHVINILDVVNANIASWLGIDRTLMP